MKTLMVLAFLLAQCTGHTGPGNGQGTELERYLDREIAMINWGPSTNGLRAGLVLDRGRGAGYLADWAVLSCILNARPPAIDHVRLPRSQYGIVVGLKDSQGNSIKKSWYGRSRYPRLNLIFGQQELARIWRRSAPQHPIPLLPKYPRWAYALEPLRIFRIPQPGQYTLSAQLMVLIKGSVTVLPPVECQVQISAEDMGISQFREPFQSDWANGAAIIGSIGASAWVFRWGARRLKRLVPPSEPVVRPPPPGFPSDDPGIRV